MNEWADIRRIKARLASDLVRVLAENGWSDDAASQRLKITGAEIGRLRKADVDSFSVDDLLGFLGRLDQRVELHVTATDAPAQASLLQKIEAISSGVPAGEWDRLPRDLAGHHDRYLYRAPDRD